MGIGSAALLGAATWLSSSIGCSVGPRKALPPWVFQLLEQVIVKTHGPAGCDPPLGALGSRSVANAFLASLARAPRGRAGSFTVSANDAPKLDCDAFSAAGRYEPSCPCAFFGDPERACACTANTVFASRSGSQQGPEYELTQLPEVPSLRSAGSTKIGSLERRSRTVRPERW